MKRTSACVIAFLMISCLCVGATSARAATVGTKLRAELDTASPRDVIPVIITLSDRVNLKQFRDRNLSVRRSNLISALKRKAAFSQRGLEAYLRSRGLPGIKRLWLINALAVHLPASVIRVVERFPAVDSIRLDETISVSDMGAAEPAVSIDDVSVDETAGIAEFTVSLSEPATGVETVDFASADVNALADADYTAVSGQLSFALDETSQTITVPILDDPDFEVDETFTITLSNPQGGATLADDTGIATIIDNETPHISIDDVTVDEAAGSAVFTVSLSVASSGVETVDFASADVSAVAGVGFDYLPVTGSLSFAIGETSQTITVPILEDSYYEADETFNLILSNAASATLSDDTGVATIIDNETPHLSIDDVTVGEAAGSAVFTVTRTGDTGPVILVSVDGVDGSALAGNDYQLDPVQLTFLSGVTSQTVDVQILEDMLYEGDETFTVTLSNPLGGATLADDTGIGTITDNDMPVLSIDDAGVAETAGNAVFTVTRTGDTSTPVSVNYASADVSALAGADYSPVSWSLSFAVEETSQTITVPILEDQDIEMDETFTVTLSNAVGASLDKAIGVGTIFGNQPPAGTPEWNLSHINAPDLWALGYIGQGVVVANVDTGVDMNHAELAARWRGGDNSWYDVHGQHPGPHDAAGTKSGHGTRTMGIMVGSDANPFGTAIGVTPGARWIAVKVWNDAGIAETSDFTLGLQWLLDPDGDPSTDDSPDVINNSWGFDQQAGVCHPDYLYQAEIQALQAAGIAVVFSAGNSGNLGSVSPANYPEGYAAGSVDMYGALATSSSRGPSACDGSIFPEVVAPGVNIYTTTLYNFETPQNSWDSMASGTSFSAPHVASAMALLLSVFPDTGVADLESALIQSAQELGDPGPDNDYGYGLIDVMGAYNWLATAPDSDGDGVSDVNDNCIDVPNGPLLPDGGGNSQLDTDGDGYGNSCDADLDQTGFVDFSDLTAFSNAFFTADPDADIDGTGFVDFSDLTLFSASFFQAPGPSCCGIPLP